MTDRPNILFFFADDQRFDTIRALGNPHIHTPNLDELAARGMTFTHAHIPGGTHGAVCMPSRAMLLTGRNLFHIEREGQEIPAAHTTMGECFQKAGHATFGTGKWHNGRNAYARCFDDGDEIFFGGMADHWNVPAYQFDPTGRYETRSPYVADPFHSNAVTYRECDHIHAGKHSTELFLESSARLLKERDASRPFFLYVALMAPHDPRTMPKRFLDLYDPADIPLPENFLPQHPIDTGALDCRDELLAASPRDPEEIRRHIAEYYAMISHLDDALGRLLTVLEERGELENTIVVFAGDNGLALGQHGLMGKQNLYDHSVRVPLIFAGPGVPKGQRSDALAYLLDIFPTLCDLTNTEIPESVEGKSLAPILNAPDATARDILYLAYAEHIRGVTDGRVKLIEYACGTTQLFDLVADPLEMTNLADRPESRETVTRLRQQLVQMAAELDDEAHPTGKAFWSKRTDIEED